MNKDLLSYDVLSAFNEIYYDNVFTFSNFASEHIFLTKYIRPDGAIVSDVNKSFYVLKNDTDKYLLESSEQGMDLKEVLPIKVLETEKISFTGKIYFKILRYKSVKFKAEKKLGFREIVDILSSIKHSNPRAYKISVMMDIMGWLGRSNYIKASNPGFGKDSNLAILNYLLGGCSTIESPNRPKLELLSNNSLLGITEVVSPKKEVWDTVSTYLLEAAAFKNHITKSTRAYKDVGETIDMSDTSITLLYNDIIDYTKSKQEKYFDFVADTPLKDRFPFFLFNGSVEQDFSTITKQQAYQLAKENMGFFKDIIHSLHYYKENYTSLIDYKNIDAHIKNIPNRKRKSLKHLLSGFALYSKTNAELEAWIKQIIKLQDEYTYMLQFYYELMNKIEEFNHPIQKKCKRLRDKYKSYEKMITHINELFLSEKEITQGGLNGFY